MSNPLIERHGWVSYDIIGDDNLAFWGIWARVFCSTADITTTLPYTQATTPTTADTVQTNGEIIVMKMDADPLLSVIIEPFSGDNPINPSNTINGSSANIVLKNQFDYAHFVNNGGVDIEMIGMGTLTLNQIVKSS
jgi:hypothetical protein